MRQGVYGSYVTAIPGACVDCPLGRSVGQVLALEQWNPLFEAAGL